MSAIALENKMILVTGAAGFIGSNLVKRICEEVPSAKVVGIDSVNDYYDVALKEFRLNELSKYESFTFIKGNIANKELITEIFTKYKPAVVVNLAAQAGVRYSITNPDAYVEANLIGFYNILEACRHSYDDGETGVEHLVKTRKLEKNIEVVGWADFDKKLELLSSVSTVVLPSYNEGLPMSILEGMACGKAIVSTTVGAIPEVINKENGILVEAGDVQALSEALVECSQDLETIKKMSIANIAKIQNQFSMGVMH